VREKLAVLVVLVTITGAVFGALEYFARAADVAEWEDRMEVQYEQLAQRLERKILQDDIRAIAQRLWQLEDRYGNEPLVNWPQRDRDEYRKLTEERKTLEWELQR